MRVLPIFSAVTSMAIATNNFVDWDLEDLSTNDFFPDDSLLSGFLDKANVDAFLVKLQDEPTIDTFGCLDVAN
jgi:hypothetical protein